MTKGRDTWRVTLIAAEVQALEKNLTGSTIICCYLADHLSVVFMEIQWREWSTLSSLIDMLFHTLWSRRQGTQTADYHITDTTNIDNVSMKRLLSHSYRKMELTGYLGQKILEHASVKGRRVVAWGTQCKITYNDKSYMNTEQRPGRGWYKTDTTCCWCDCLRCNKYWHLLTGHWCVSLGYPPLYQTFV